MGGRKGRKKGKKKKKGGSDRWIQKAIKHPGALKAWLKRHRSEVKKATGMNPFTKSGEVNTKCLQKLRHTKYYQKLSPTTKRRINLAITLEKFHKG